MAHGLPQLAQRPKVAIVRVALVCPYDLGVAGGVQSHVLGLAGWLARHGVEAVVVGPGDRADAGVTIRSVGRSRRIRANDSVAPIGVDPRMVRRLGEAVAGVDVVHIHEPFVSVAGWAAMRTDKPTILTFHADPPAWVRRAYRAGRFLVARRLARTSAITAVSRVAATAVRALGVEPEIVPNAVELPSRRPDLDARALAVTFVGRDDPRKGLDVLLAAWPKIRAANPNAVLTVVSNAPPVEAEGVDHRGPVSNEAKVAALRDTKVFVAPNRRGESFGITLIEAMAAGCALVASDIPAFRAVAGEAARFVPPGDVDALAAAVNGMLADDADRIARAERGWVDVQRFGWDTVGGIYERMYHNAQHS